MGKSAHTPGPWKRFKSLHWAARMYIRDSNDAHVAIVHTRNGELERPDAEADANANLIAAAPDLYTACKAVAHAASIASSESQFGECVTEVMSILNAAIEKVETKEHAK